MAANSSPRRATASSSRARSPTRSAPARRCENRARRAQFLDQFGPIRHSATGARLDGNRSAAPRERPMTRTAAVSKMSAPPAAARSGASSSGAADNFPKMLLDHARLRPERPAMREKDYGIWQSWSWAKVAGEVEALAGGLKRLGFARDDKLA